MTLKPDARERTVFGIAALAILLRSASDWLFSTGGPLPYQMIQAALLGLALVLLRPRVDAVFLKDGLNKHPICLMRIIRYLANLKQKQKIF